MRSTEGHESVCICVYGGGRYIDKDEAGRVLARKECIDY